MTSVARSTLIRSVLNKLFPADYLEFAALDNSDTTTTTVAATELRDADASDQVYDGGWLYVYAGTSAYDFRRISEFNPTAAAAYGTVTLGRALSADPDTTSNCAVYAGPLSVGDIRRLINEALRRLRRPRTLALTLVEDGTMEASGTSSWTASSASLSKATSAANIFEGASALLVDNSGAGGYAQSASINAIPNERLAVEAIARVGNTSGSHTATLRAYDVTNGATIDTVETDNRERTVLRLAFTVPSGCLQVAFRLEGSGATTDVYWDEVACWRPGTRQVALPSDFAEPDQVKKVYLRLPRSASVSGESGAYDAFDLTHRLLPGWKLLADPTGATHYWLDLSDTAYSGSGPILVEGSLPYAELSADTDTTHAPQDRVVDKVRALAYEELAQAGPRDERKHYAEQASRHRVNQLYRGAFGPRPAVPVGRRTQGR